MDGNNGLEPHYFFDSVAGLYRDRDTWDPVALGDLHPPDREWYADHLSKLNAKPDPHSDVDHNLGTLPVRDFVLDPITPAYRGRLLLSDPYPLFRTRLIDALEDTVIDIVSDDDAVLDPNADSLRKFYADFASKPNWDIYPVNDAGLKSDPGFNPHEHANKLTMAIIDRHLQAAYAEIAATLLGATGDDSEGNPDAEADADPAGNCC